MQVPINMDPLYLLEGGIIMSADLRLLKIVLIIQTSCSGSSEDIDEESTSSLVHAADICLGMG